MTVWDSAMAMLPQWQGHIEILDRSVSRMRDVDARIVDAAGAMGALGERILDEDTAPVGIYGYGFWSQSKTDPVPAIFVQPGLAPVGGAPASITPAGIMFESVQMSIPAGTIAVALPPPQLQAGQARSAAVGPGMTVTIGSRRATLGIRVFGPASERAILTAGHAAPSPRAIVRDEAGDQVGTILSRACLDDVPAGTPTADAAVVVIDPRREEAETDIGLYVDAARPLDDVRLGGANSGSWIRGVSPEFALTQRQGYWGHVAITAEAISKEGDSGAPVMRTDGAVVGQIVAGYGSAYSVVQDIEYILRQIGVALR
jgi:hypothetical protein